MSKKLSNIRTFLKKDLEIYDKTLKDILRSNVFLIDNISKYIVKHKGKGLRPLLVILSARLLGEPNKNTYNIQQVKDDCRGPVHIRTQYKPKVLAIKLFCNNSQPNDINGEKYRYRHDIEFQIEDNIHPVTLIGYSNQ